MASHSLRSSLSRLSSNLTTRIASLAHLFFEELSHKITKVSLDT